MKLIDKRDSKHLMDYNKVGLFRLEGLCEHLFGFGGGAYIEKK